MVKFLCFGEKSDLVSQSGLVEKIAEKINSISLSGGAQVVEQLREIFIKTE